MGNCFSLGFCFLSASLLTAVAHAQLADPTNVLPPAEVEQIETASAALLENAQRLLAAEQWSEAVEAIRRVQEADASRLLKVDLALPLTGFERYVTAGQYCQWRLAALAAEAPEALAHYHRLVDPLADRWFHDGSENNEEALLRRIVDQAFASHRGDDALLKLGDLALARGDPALARSTWQQISPMFTVPPAAADAFRAPAGSPLWLPLRHFDFTAHGHELATYLKAPGTPLPGTYPDTDLDRAAIQARLVLASIFEGSGERARVELALLRLLFPKASGKLANLDGRYADTLQDLLESSAGWQPPKQSTDWTTFGGDSARGKIAASEIDIAGRPLWSYSLPRLSSDQELIGAGRLRPADDGDALLSYHPIVVDGEVLVRFDVRANSYVAALDLKSGKPLWQVDYSRGLTSDSPQGEDAHNPEASDAHAGLVQHIGVARYTLSAVGQKIFARMGSPITAAKARRAGLGLAKEQGFLLGLDMSTQGKPLEGFPILPPSNEWTFEGTPLSDGGNVYVAMRRLEGTRSQLYLAAFELATTSNPQVDPSDENARPTGRLKWRTRICSASTLGAGQHDELTHLLVAQQSGRLYLNTNCGVIAAVNVDDGRLLWLVKYPRAAARLGSLDQPQHLFRDLVPCLTWRELVIVAPADSNRIFALEASTGQIAWALPPEAADDAMHLLGVADDVLFASGDHLYWIDAHTGRLLTQFPAGTPGASDQAAPSPRGLGRGVLAGSRVWWPTRESILVFDSQPVRTDFGRQPRLVRDIPLLTRGITGGNLVIANGILLIASGDKLVAFGQ